MSASDRTEAHPPCSRLFVTIGPQFTEEEVRESFSAFGQIDDIYIPLDKAKGEQGVKRGFCFIKFARTSAAAAAMDALDGRCLPGHSNTIHVAVSGARRSDGDRKSDVIPNRVIVCMPGEADPQDVRDVFCKYGQIEDVRVTQSNSRRAVVRFTTFLEAARCFEEAPSGYKVDFVMPKKKEKPSSEDSVVISRGVAANSSGFGFNSVAGNGGSSFTPIMPNNPCELRVVFNASLNNDQLFTVFNIVPNLVDLQIVEMLACQGRAIARVVYGNSQSAAHAVDRINGMEYPIGSRLEVGLPGSGGVNSEIGSLLNTIQEASSRLLTAGINVSINTSGVPGVNSNSGGIPGMINYGYNSGGGGGSAYNSLPNSGGGGPLQLNKLSLEVNQSFSSMLPPPQPMDPEKDPSKITRLFFVMRFSRKPFIAPSPDMITNLFSRFGNLSNAHLIRGKNFGYARFTSKNSAARCKATLHNEMFDGCQVRIEEADAEVERREPKKRRFDD